MPDSLGAVMDWYTLNICVVLEWKGLQKKKDFYLHRNAFI